MTACFQEGGVTLSLSLTLCQLQRKRSHTLSLSVPIYQKLQTLSYKKDTICIHERENQHFKTIFAKSSSTEALYITMLKHAELPYYYAFLSYHPHTPGF